MYGSVNSNDNIFLGWIFKDVMLCETVIAYEEGIE